jgi:hypothetical protein
MGFFDFFRKKAPRRLMPEAGVVVRFDETDVRVEWPGQPEQSLPWSELVEVAIKTTDEGPWNPDVFWVLRFQSGSLVFPQGATGERDMLRRLQELPGFDDEELIKAMGCTENDEFGLWRKDSPR